MPVLSFNDSEAVGRVISANSRSVTICLDHIDRLERLQVNQLTVMHSNRPGRYTIGLIASIFGEYQDITSNKNISYGSSNIQTSQAGTAKISPIGTFYNRVDNKPNVFYRTLETIPEIGSNCFLLDGTRLEDFMKNVSEQDNDRQLSFGRFIFHDNSIAYLDGNKLLQRHTMIAGTTGSGKSYTAAKLLEEISKLSQANVVLFDIHGEYKEISENMGFKKLEIAGHSASTNKDELDSDDLYLPYWLLEYEELISMLGLRSMNAAPRQEALVRQEILNAKKETLDMHKVGYTEKTFNIDSPIPFNLKNVICRLKMKNSEMIPNAAGDSEVQGPYHGKLFSLISKMEARMEDHRLSFFFNAPDNQTGVQLLEKITNQIFSFSCTEESQGGGIKIIDFSSVSTELIPLIVNLIANIIFKINRSAPSRFWHPIAIFCDEANLYMSKNLRRGENYPVANDSFERIAREGRKYGIGLVVICQRPSELNSNVLSQCNNVIVMRLPYKNDQQAIQGILPDKYGEFDNLLPSLGVGEAIVIGDACTLPTPLRVTKPSCPPGGETVDFWHTWKNGSQEFCANEIALAWRGIGPDQHTMAGMRMYPPDLQDSSLTPVSSGQPDAASGTAPSDPKGARGKPDAASGAVPSDPKGARGKPDAASGAVPSDPKGARGKPDAASGAVPSDPKGARGKPDAASGAVPSDPKGARGKPDAASGAVPSDPKGARGKPDAASGAVPSDPKGARGKPDAASGAVPSDPKGARGKPDAASGAVPSDPKPDAASGAGIRRDARGKPDAASGAVPSDPKGARGKPDAASGAVPSDPKGARGKPDAASGAAPSSLQSKPSVSSKTRLASDTVKGKGTNRSATKRKPRKPPQKPKDKNREKSFNEEPAVRPDSTESNGKPNDDSSGTFKR